MADVMEVGPTYGESFSFSFIYFFFFVETRYTERADI